MSCKSLGEYYHLDGKHLQHQYKNHLSNYHNWGQKDHAKEWVLFAKNFGRHLSIDETSLSNGELYTIVTNKAAKGKKGCLVAMIKGTESSNIIKILHKIPWEKRCSVKEITLDMAASMNKVVRRCFPKAVIVIDRFHVQKLANDAVQELRIDYRWKAIDKENKAIKYAKTKGVAYQNTLLANGDTLRQLLVRSRFLLFKSPYKWSDSQRFRASILFEKYPKLKKAYDLSQALKNIFSRTKDKGVAYAKLAKWYDQVEKTGMKSFRIVSNSIKTHYIGILNYFENRSTNASAESFNAKIKAFRTAFRGVREIEFFLFRLSKIYA
ncbi:transposase [Marinifilum fragile]|uniref:ISAon1 family transposase n=2 Tax=Marinifilum TaxID=866673 RepID=UPI002AA94896|nr:transposase [Marinifilum fragile]